MSNFNNFNQFEITSNTANNIEGGKLSFNNSFRNKMSIRLIVNTTPRPQASTDLLSLEADTVVREESDLRG